MTENRVKKIRLMMGLTQVELAELLDIKQSMLARIEAQTANITAENAIALSKVANVNISELWEETNGTLTKRYDLVDMLSDYQLDQLENAVRSEKERRAQKRQPCYY